MKLIGLDVGTTSICGLLLDVEDGRILSVQTRPNSSAIAGRSPWESLQNPDAILETALGIIHGFLDAHGDIRGIGVAGQMHGILYVDKNGNAVSPLSTWEDGRGDQPFEDGTYASKVSQALGRPVSTGMGVVTHFFNRKNRLVPASAVSLCTIADYVAMKLSKTRAPVMDATNAASLGCFDPGTQDFRRKDLEGIGIDAGLFPAVRADYPALGEARPGVPVFPSLGDTQGSFLGSVRDSRNTVLVNVGTGSQVCLYVESWHDIAGIDLRPLPFGGFIGVGAALCGGRAYAVLREFFKSTVRLITGGDVEVPWDVMNAMDPSGPREPLVVDTRFSGTRLSPGVRGSVSGISLSNFTPQHLAAGDA